jgi:hypothetical protein|tara:strand:- start:2069 stop:2341 length:273 start_codon:yes stop_codon:yes gene_type:complete
MPKVTIPMASLMMANEEGEMISPSEGDAVSFTIEGTVEGVDGEMADIAMETVNGQPAYPEEEVVEEVVEEGPSRDELMAEMVEIDATGGL